MTAAEQLKISVADYLAGELISDIKHEYVNGMVYAMAGAKRSHNIISANLLGLLFNHLRGTPCRVFGSDMKVGIQTRTHDCFYYPDVHVSCEAHGHEHYNSQPELIIEVLSDSTERKDRAEKFYDYRKIPSLEEYVLVAQDSLRIEIYRRRSGWDLNLLEAGASFQFESVGLALTTADIYQGVEF
ncbi:MAG: Uma2 family endonuclease [Methylococcaceae bacterium]|nr:MAG: Uma2 family endonuclease [Methylococcaceae bacterium]